MRYVTFLGAIVSIAGAVVVVVPGASLSMKEIGEMTATRYGNNPNLEKSLLWARTTGRWGVLLIVVGAAIQGIGEAVSA